MTNVIVTIKGAFASAIANGKITTGMVGLPVQFEFDSYWKNLNRTAFFKSGNFIRKIDGIIDSATVPWEVLRTPGNRLEIGVQGKDTYGNIVLPTIWAVAGTIQQGAQGEIPAAPNPDADNNEPTNGAVIDDNQISASTTWSSEKIDYEIKNAGGNGSSENAVLYTEQELTPEQQAQARANIGAVASGDENLYFAIYGETPYDEMNESHNAGKYLVCKDGEFFLEAFRVVVGSAFYFIRTSQTAITIAICKVSGWSKSTYTFEQIVKSSLDSLGVTEDIQKLQSDVSDIETALDNIIAIQNALIGGDGE